MSGFINLEDVVWLDVVLLTAIVLSLGLGFFRGIVREILSLSSWVVAAWLAYLYGNNFSRIITPWLESEKLSTLVSFVIVFVGVLIVLSLAGGLVLRLFRVAGPAGTGRFLGSLFGLIRGFVIVTVFLSMAGLVSTFERSIGRTTPLTSQPWFKSSTIVPYFEPSVVWFTAKVSEQLNNSAFPIDSI